jgi:cytochrome c-type biogenesis protein CcmH
MLAWLLALSLVLPQQTPSDSIVELQTRQLATELRCPICQGLSLQDSPAELSQEMRAVIRAQLREGKTPAEVRAYFVAKYGEWILLKPQAKGFNLAIYVLPIVMLLGGALLIVFLARRWSRLSQSSSQPT